MHRSGLPHPAESRLADLISRMREAGWEPSAEEVAEALWLARWASADADEAVSPDPVPDGEEEGEAAAEPSRPGSQPPPDERPSEDETGARPPARHTPSLSTVSLYAPDRHGGAPSSAFPVRAPAASTLPGLLGLQRAMRPLLGYRSRVPSVTRVLDEAASAELSARSGAVRPVFGPSRRPDAELLLLMDASATTSVWQLTFEKLRQTCERLGAFRDVQALCLHRGGPGLAPLIGTGPDRSATRLRPADQYRDTTGRRLTLVVSDCVGSLWQDGGAQRMLHRWSGSSPLAVVQPLPPRLWPRTALPGESGLLVRDKGPGGPVTFEPDGYGPPPADDALPVPVLLPTPAALGSWARLLGGEGRQTVRGAAAWVSPRHHAMPAPPAPQGADARELLNAFRASASPGALDLAVHLAAVPLVLPVIQLVQEAMFPDTGPMELAEVLLSGLLERLPDVEDSPGPRYDFVNGVQNLLLQSLDQGAAELVLKHLSEYVTRHFGKGTRNFPALAVAQLSGRTADVERAHPEHDEPEYDEGELGEELFAEIPARVVRWYRPVRPLPDQLKDAERLLDQWRVQRDSKLLREAHEVTEAVLLAEDSEWARRVLGRVLFAQAGTPEARRDPQRRRRLLTRAEHLLSGEGSDRPATVLARAGVRHELWRMDGDSAWLRAVVSDLSEPFEDEEPDQATQEDRRVRLGRALLDMARTERDRTSAEECATAAAGQLREAADLSGAAGVPVQRRAAVLLDLVAALRLTGSADHAEVLRLLADAEPAARADPAAPGGRNLLLRWARTLARVYREAGDLQAADQAYEEAAELTARDSPQRCELFIEWGETRLLRDDDPAGAEGILREALTVAPGSGPLPGRAQLLLGKALLRRWKRGHFPPDLFEGSHLLELAARQSHQAVQRAESWRLLGDARMAFPDARPPFTPAQRAYQDAVSEAREVPGARTSGSVEAARALHALAALYERCHEPRRALATYREAGEEWQRLAGMLAPVPWEEAGRTRERIESLEAGEATGAQ
ncbi:SAV_2336 N-terminal domain-related protein [Streptomyces winkii]|uniref:SAV_2336 N-terminal domain-related protein n=1 Tax=Streptomyces winkii TaxID=3051178 RepID=UPI0028D24C7A|nr:SAV_2336 N-terminal domain-related protein [Streptomyces sp. DSM 40971]